jgi:hypothetical protein
MLSRVTLILLALFWLGMNVLLWRAEFGGRDSAGSAVPASVVWQKMLTAPDSSSLTVLHHGKKVGFCHWVTSIGEELARLNETEAPPEGMQRRPASYRLHLEGNLALEDLGARVRFDSSLKLTTNQIWQEFNARLNLRPTLLEIKAVAAEKAVHIQTVEGKEKSERVLKFSDLQNPTALIAEFGGPAASEIWNNIELSGGILPRATLGEGLRWEACNDSIKIGHSKVRTYRLQTTLLDRYRAVIFVSRVGEILRVELPDELLLVNDQLANY